MFFLTVEFKLINIERMLDREKSLFGKYYDVIIVGKNDCEMLSRVGKSIMVSKIFS